MATLKVTPIPIEFSSIIPKFGGDEKLLNLYINKCEYVLNCFHSEDKQAQDLYNFHVASSKLTGRAAILLSERQDIQTWVELKEFLLQHFRDPRSEECIAIELENLKIKSGESYSDFYNRIQQVKSTLIAKVNLIENEYLKQSKITIYDNMAYNVFLFNLPEDLFRIVRLKCCNSLYEALSVVLEEINFQYQYNSKGQMLRSGNTNPEFTFQNPNMTQFGVKPAITHLYQKPFNNLPDSQQNLKFGAPFNQSSKPQHFGSSSLSFGASPSNQPKFGTMSLQQPNIQGNTASSARPILPAPLNSHSSSLFQVDKFGVDSTKNKPEQSGKESELINSNNASGDGK